MPPAVMGAHELLAVMSQRSGQETTYPVHSMAIAS